MIQTFERPLPHGITLSCRAAGQPGRPVLLFLHGFPEGAFVWDPLLEHFAQPEHGAWRCVAPNLRGYERSSAPTDVAAYRPRHLVQDICALIQAESGDAPLGALVAHDWGGAVAWNLANQHPALMQRLVIVNSPHPGAFLRELQTNPQQQAASAYMNFLVRPDAEALLAQDDYRRLWEFFTAMGAGATGAPGTPRPVGAGWLTEAVKARYREVWRHGLQGPCHYYRASPLRPPSGQDAGAAAVSLPREALTVDVPTLVLWALDDTALHPGLIDGLGDWVPRLQLQTVPQATHWIVHERPHWLATRIETYLHQKQ